MQALDHPALPLARRAYDADVSLSLVSRQPCLSKAIAMCVQLSGLEEKEIYMALEINAGHWSRISKGEAHFPVNKLGALMDFCGNEAPLMWLAYSRGKGLVLLKSDAERRAEATEHALAAERERTAWLTELLKGKP